MNRRRFLKNSLFAGSALAFAAPQFSIAEQTDKFILSAPLTHSDWMLKPGIAWGPEGVRHMLDTCKACGWTRIHWRVFDGGRSLYKSKLLKAMGKWDEDSIWSPQSVADKQLVERY